MRLALFTNQFPGRVSTFFARDVRSLLENGFEVDIFALYPHRPELWKYVPEILDEEHLSRDRVRHADFKKMLRSVRFSNLKRDRMILGDALSITLSSMRFGLRPIAKSVYSILQGVHWSREYAAPYDHVLAYWANYSATAAYFFHRLLNRPIPYSMMIHAGTDLYRDQVYLRQKLLYADNIIVVCEFNKTFLKEKYPDLFPKLEKKFFIHHPGLDFGEYLWKANRASVTTIVAAGQMTKIKGFEYLLRAAKKLIRRGIDIRLELVGDGEEGPSLRTLAERLCILDRVKFHGWLTPEATRDVISRATILVHPSSGLGDAVPTVIKEAMALGTPVIASNIAGIPELLDGGRCGILLPPRNVPALATEIENLLADDDLRKHYSAVARKFAEEKFNLWTNGASLANLLHSKSVPEPLMNP